MNPTPTWMMYLQIANFLLTWITGAYVFWDRKRSAASKRLVAIEERLRKLENPPADERWGKLEKRLLQIETEVKKPRPVCPNHERMEQNDVKLFERLDELHGDIRELTGGVKALTKAMEMINEYLLKERK